jgi:hypothetical protein
MVNHRQPAGKQDTAISRHRFHLRFEFFTFLLTKTTAAVKLTELARCCSFRWNAKTIGMEVKSGSAKRSFVFDTSVLIYTPDVYLYIRNQLHAYCEDFFN